MKQAVKTFKKTFNLKLFTTKEEQLFTKFKKVAVYRGHSVHEQLMRMISNYVHIQAPDNIKLVTEGEMLDELEKNKLRTTKAILLKHRQRGNLEGMWWTNKEGKVVYNPVPIVKFFKGRQGRGSGGWLNRKEKNERVAA